MGRLAVIALGGNAFTLEGESGRHEDQQAHAAEMAEVIVGMLSDGWGVVLVHGNGPQVGNLAIQQENGADLVPPQPLSALVAMTQGDLGSLIGTAVYNATNGRQTVAALITHAVVSATDPAMTSPTKPIGPFLTEQQARTLAADRGWTVRPDSGRGFRRVVPSPVPTEIVEVEAVRSLVDTGHVVVTGGGGGIPVLHREGHLSYTDAVIDKDYVAAELAGALGADVLIIVTAVESVQLDFGTPQQRRVGRMDVEAAERHLADGQFPEGSMGPKVRAAGRFVRRGGGTAIITTADHVVAALAATDDSVGTRIVAAGAADRAAVHAG